MTMNTVSASLAEVEDRADVRVHELRRRLRLAAEALAHLGVAREMRVQHLDRRRARSSGIVLGAVHVRHAAAAEPPEDAIAAARRAAQRGDLLVGLLARRARRPRAARPCSGCTTRRARDSRCRIRDRTPSALRTASARSRTAATGPYTRRASRASRFCSSRTMSLNSSHRSRSTRNDARAAGPTSPAWLLITTDATA